MQCGGQGADTALAACMRWGTLTLLLAGSAMLPAQQAASPELTTTGDTAYIDAHAHLDHFDAAAISAMLAVMHSAGVSRTVLLVPPYTFRDPARYASERILAVAQQHPMQLSVVGGGDSLNALLIQQAARSGPLSEAVRRRFTRRAHELLREGVVGFGEITTEHFPSPGSADYQSAPPDHPLLRLLADIAADADVPIVLHMEALPQDMPLPPGLSSPPDPPRLHGNIAALERLLSHNPRAKIIWAHAGVDATGFRTPELCRRLLAAHPNLFMELKVDPVSAGKNPLVANGQLQAPWLRLISEFPDRFIFGSDQHYPAGAGPQRWQAMQALFGQLPPPLRRQLAVENPARLYHLPRS